MKVAYRELLANTIMNSMTLPLSIDEITFVHIQ